MKKVKNGSLRNAFRITIFILFVTSIILMNFSPYGVPGLEKYGQSAKYLDMVFHYTPDFVYSMLDDIGYMGILAHIRVNFIDFLFMFSFFTIQIILTKGILKKVNAGNKLNRVLIPVYLQVASDILENILLIAVLINYPNEMNTTITVASYITIFKWIALISWVVALAMIVIKYRIKKK